MINSFASNENDPENKDQNLDEEVKEEVSCNHGKEQSPSCTQTSDETTAVNLESSSSHSSNISSEELPAVSTQPAQSPPQAASINFASQPQSSPETSSLQTIPTTTGGYLEPSRNTQASIAAPEGNQNNLLTIAPGNIINFSEFERESDPFEKAELQTINDMQALAAVFPQTSNYKNSDAGIPSTSTSTVNINQVYNSVQSNRHPTVVTSGNQQSATGAFSQQGTFQYSQQPLAQAIAKVPTTHSSAQYNTYYQQPHTGSMPQQPLGNYYSQGKFCSYFYSS